MPRRVAASGHALSAQLGTGGPVESSVRPFDGEQETVQEAQPGNHRNMSPVGASRVAEEFSSAEQERLAPYVTDTTGTVFALRGLPEVVKGALFARYSRSGKSLRRLLLDEFLEGESPIAASSPESAILEEGVAGAGSARAERLYARMLDDYGDDSVAQLGGAHVACEQVSNVMTKVLERGRLAAYLEQSTRYVPYTDRPGGHWRYHLDPALAASSLGPRAITVFDAAFAAYADAVAVLEEHLAQRTPRAEGASDAAWRRAVRAAALDGARGMLPAAATANVGIFASGQAWERLVMRLRAHPLPEASALAEQLLVQLRQVIPSFLRRVDVPARGGAWVEYLAHTAAETKAVVADLFPETGGLDGIEGEPRDRAGWGPGSVSRWPATGRPIDGVTLVEFDPQAEDKVLTALAYPWLDASEEEIARKVATMSTEERARLWEAGIGQRANRRHLPGRAFERALYTFDIVCDYGAFRDLQRHRMATVSWQPLTTALGAVRPGVIDDAGLTASFDTVMASLEELYASLSVHLPAAAPYAVALAHRIRFSFTVNARELLHITELRSGIAGHPSYRRVALAMVALIEEQAGHRWLRQAMQYVDCTPPGGEGDLGRLGAEERTEARRRATEAVTHVGA